MSKYQKVNELIQLWEEYETKSGNEDFASFGVWLHNRQSDDKFSAETDKEEEEDNFRAGIKADEIDYYKKISTLNGQISSLLVRLNRFIFYYSKKVFKDLPISNNQEFSFLACIEGMTNPKKSEVISINVTEVTTGTEILKRLIRSGLVDEVSDIEDKRIKRMKITAKGKKVCVEAKHRLLDTAKLVMGNLSEEEKLVFVQQLIQLNKYNNEVYYNQSHLSINELIEKNILKN